MKEKTWEELKNDEMGTIYVDELKGKLRFIIMRGPGGLCAYMGVPLKHPLAGHGYDDLPVDCHGGLTFGAEGDGDFRPKEYWWYGWDYSHCDDASFSYSLKEEARKWLVKDVEEDSWEAMYDFERLVGLAEKIYAKEWEVKK